MPRTAATLNAAAPREFIARAGLVLDAGFDSLVLAHPFHKVHWDELRPALPTESIAAVALFLPYPRGVPPGAPCPFDVAAPHPEDRSDAVQQGIETIRLADSHGARCVLVDPVRLEGGLRAQAAAVPKGSGARGFIESLLRLREVEAAVRLDAFRAVLYKLLEVAARYSVTIALTPGGFMDEAPDADEVALLLREMRGAPLSVWPDTLRVEASIDIERAGVSRSSAPLPRWVGQRGAPRLPAGKPVYLDPGLREPQGGGAPRGPWTRFAGQVAGSLVRDADALLAPVPPGDGRVDWSAAKSLLDESPVLCAIPGEGSGGAERALDALERVRRGPEEAARPGLDLRA